jgi:hypothetical protein
MIRINIIKNRGEFKKIKYLVEFLEKLPTKTLKK